MKLETNPNSVVEDASSTPLPVSHGYPSFSRRTFLFAAAVSITAAITGCKDKAGLTPAPAAMDTPIQPANTPVATAAMPIADVGVNEENESTLTAEVAGVFETNIWEMLEQFNASSLASNYTPGKIADLRTRYEALLENEGNGIQPTLRKLSEGNPIYLSVYWETPESNSGYRESAVPKVTLEAFLDKPSSFGGNRHTLVEGQRASNDPAEPFTITILPYESDQEVSAGETLSDNHYWHEFLSIISEMQADGFYYNLNAYINSLPNGRPVEAFVMDLEGNLSVFTDYEVYQNWLDKQSE